MRYRDLFYFERDFTVLRINRDDVANTPDEIVRLNRTPTRLVTFPGLFRDAATS